MSSSDSDSFHSASHSRASTPSTLLTDRSSSDVDYVYFRSSANLKHVDALFPTGQRVLVCLKQQQIMTSAKGAECVPSFAFSALSEMSEAMGEPRLKETVAWSKVMTEVNGQEVEFYQCDSKGDYPSQAAVVSLTSTDNESFTPASAIALFSTNALRVIYHIPGPSTSLYLLERAPFVFPPLDTTPTPFGVPTLEDWKRLWGAWDHVTLGMIPSTLLHTKPIDLRHKCLFYIGHIPTFLDMLLSHLFEEPYTKREFCSIFERGIDPHVDDPDHCHNHSEVPEADEDWPALEAVLAFRDRVRARLQAVYDDIASGKRQLTRRVARTLVMTYEHEGFHIETILYMLIQLSGYGMLPPPGFTPPPFPSLATQWSHISSPSTLYASFPIKTTLTLGHGDDEPADLTLFADSTAAEVEAHEFGWDNESPERNVEVKPFGIEWRPVSNGEYRAMWEEAKVGLEVPASWVVEGDEVKVRTLYGPVPFAVAQYWPVLASYDDLAKYAAHKGGRMPTEHELRLFLDKYEVGHAGGANVGFRNWHPMPATTGMDADAGRGSNGGVWEWTSDAFDTHPGFSGTSIFPGYSSDFFDGKHHVVLGASYATIPRLGRRTVRNFYQHNYPYAWVAGRVAYDL